MKLSFLLIATFFAQFLQALGGQSAISVDCSDFLVATDCTFLAVTLVTDEYISYAQMLQERISQLTTGACKLEILYAGSENKLYQNRAKTTENEVQYDNKFAGVDVKNVAIQEILDCMPESSILLWIDATVLLMNFVQNDVPSIIGSSQISFAREGSKSINIGVMIIRNEQATKLFFRRVTKYIRHGYWDQGVISCMLSMRTRHDCSRIKFFSRIHWSLLPVSFAEVFRVRSSGMCPVSRFFNQKAPSFIKLIGPDPRERMSCMERACKAQHVLTNITCLSR